MMKLQAVPDDVFDVYIHISNTTFAQLALDTRISALLNATRSITLFVDMH